VTTRALHTGLSVGAPWLARGLVVSAVVHALVGGGLAVAMHARSAADRELVDIELAPPPPAVEALPAELAAAHRDEPAANEPEPAATAPHHDDEGGGMDAGVDAGRDARADAAHDAGVDAPADAMVDAAIDAAIDAAPDDDGGVTPMVASAGDAAIDDASALSTVALAGSGSAGSGSAAETLPAVDGAPTTAGTAANLLAYLPAGHVITALVRFDRLRGTEWAEQTERLLRPLPDYQGLFGKRDAHLATAIDALVISSPRPRDATATTLVMKAHVARADVRALLANPTAPFTWSAASGGLVGRRGGKLFAGDRRVLISPWRDWYVLAQPGDVGDALAPRAGGDLDAIEATGKLPTWLQTIRAIVAESGEDARGPAVVVTFGRDAKRFTVPDLGLGATSVPAPQRVSLAAEQVKQGWLVRGNLVFASEADATELVASIGEAQRRISGSRVLSALLRRQHVLDAIVGLSLARTGARVSYTTSVSIADARAVLGAASVMLDQYFAGATP